MRPPSLSLLLLLGLLPFGLRPAAGLADPAPAASRAEAPLELLHQAQEAALRWSAPNPGHEPADLFRAAATGLAAEARRHPRDASLIVAQAQALAGAGLFAPARLTLDRVPAGERSAAGRALAASLEARSRCDRWAREAGNTLVASAELPDGLWLIATARPKPSILGGDNLGAAQLSLVTTAPKVRVEWSRTLLGPDNQLADQGLFELPPYPQPRADQVPVLTRVRLLVRPSGDATLVYVSQEVQGASWDPAQVDVYHYAERKLTWTATTGSYGRALVQDEDGDGHAELLAFHPMGWTQSTAHPLLWVETLEWDGVAWQEANRKFARRYEPLVSQLEPACQKHPEDPDLLFHLARGLAALGKNGAALERANQAIAAADHWSKPQPDPSERAEEKALVRQFFPTAAAAR